MQSAVLFFFVTVQLVDCGFNLRCHFRCNPITWECNQITVLLLVKKVTLYTVDVVHQVFVFLGNHLRGKIISLRDTETLPAFQQTVTCIMCRTFKFDLTWPGVY